MDSQRVGAEQPGDEGGEGGEGGQGGERQAMRGGARAGDVEGGKSRQTGQRLEGHL